MFSLIVKGSAWADGQDSFPISRIFEYTDQPLVDRFKPGGILDIASLTQLPTLLVEETSGRNGTEVAQITILLRGHVSGRDVVLEYVRDPAFSAIPNQRLQTLSSELGLNDFQFTRTHWSIKSGDLFRTLLKNLQPRPNKPTVFQIGDPAIIEPTLVSVMMPFHPSFNPVYEALQRTANDAGLRCRRADDIWENPAVIQDVVSLIDRSRAVICDCSTRNPNVFYEIGIAHTLGREVILITQSSEDVPFDLRHLRYVQYLNNGEGLAKLAVQIHKRLEVLK